MWLKTFRSIFGAVVWQSRPAPAGFLASILRSPGTGGERGLQVRRPPARNPRPALLVLGEPVDSGGGGVRGRLPPGGSAFSV